MFSIRRARRGFTFIELLMVVAVVGILAAIAVTKAGNTRARANSAAMHSDLHNVTTVQEAFFLEHARYTQALDSLKFSGSPGDVLVVVEATVTGWSVTASNPVANPPFCALFFGTAAPVAPATAPGLVACQ